MQRFRFDTFNWILLGIGLAMMIAGFIVMGTGDKTLSPVLLVLAYLVVFPWAIMRGFKARNGESGPKE